MPAKKKKVKVTLKRSVIGILPKHKECVKSLGLRRTNHTIIIDTNAHVEGALKKVGYLLQVEEV